MNQNPSILPLAAFYLTLMTSVFASILVGRLVVPSTTRLTQLVVNAYVASVFASMAVAILLVASQLLTGDAFRYISPTLSSACVFAQMCVAGLGSGMSFQKRP